MHVARVEIDVRDTDSQRFLQGRQRTMNSRWYLPARVDTTCFLFGVEQQNLAVVVVGHAIDRTLPTERTTHIIALPQQPLGQDRLADLPLLLAVVRQSVPAAARAAQSGSLSAGTNCCREVVPPLPANLCFQSRHGAA